MRKVFAFCAVPCLLAACATTTKPVGEADPFESVNREIHALNKTIDQVALRPISQVANEVPEPVSTRIIKFSDNTSLPGMVLNGLLQGDFEGATTNTLRFAINTSVGGLGFFDPAGVIGLEEHSTDFGETLYVWGFADGPYVELPLYGPSTTRDAVGRVVDSVIDPLGWVGVDPLTDYSTVAYVGEKVVERGLYGGTLDTMLYESADSYAQAKLFYQQNRAFELSDSVPITAPWLLGYGQTETHAGVDPYAPADPYADPYEE